MWFSTAFVTDGGLVIPGAPKRRCATLVLRPDALFVQAKDTQGRLSWEDQGRQWYIGSYPQGPYGNLAAQPLPTQNLSYSLIGAGLVTQGDSAARVAAVLVTLAASGRLVPIGDPVSRAFKHGSIVPLHKPRAGQPAVYRHDSTIRILCALLKERPDLRPRLADEARCAQLRLDILNNALNPGAEHLGLRTKSIEIHNAMRALGLVHHFGGRPIPDDQLTDRDAAAETIAKRLSSGRFSKELAIDESQIREALSADYYDAAPWPFDALTEA